jgi:hypothetical protein
MKNYSKNGPGAAANPGAQERIAFETHEAKLKRRRIKFELQMWQVEIDLLKLYAEYASDAKRVEYEKQIAELERTVDELAEQLMLIRKFKKHEPKILVTTFEKTLDETAQAFASAEKVIEQARPHMEPAPH